MSRAVPSQVVAMIDEHFGNAKSSPNFNAQPDAAPKLAAIVQLVREIPDELIRISGSDYSNLVLGVSMLDYMAKSWQERGNVTVPQKVRKVHALSILREVLCKCPDEAPSPTSAKLSFVKDDELRDSIRLDISSAESNLHSGEWKGATVLAGAASEALLLWAIQNRKKPKEVDVALQKLASGPQAVSPKNQNPETWGFREYIEVSVELGLVTTDTAEQARLGKDFRNLVHPGRAKRLGQKCDRATALSAIAAVEHIVRDLA